MSKQFMPVLLQAKLALQSPTPRQVPLDFHWVFMMHLHIEASGDSIMDLHDLPAPFNAGVSPALGVMPSKAFGVAATL